MKKQRTPLFLTIAVLGFLTAMPARGDDKPAKAKERPSEQVRLYVEGAYCPGCASVLSSALVAAGVDKHTRIAPNRGKGYVIVLGDFGHQADLGAVAKAVNDADTPHRKQAQPGVSLELFADLDKASAPKALEALGKVAGVDAKGSTVDLDRGVIGARLAGGAKFSVADILAALQQQGIAARIITAKVVQPQAK